MKTIWYIAKKDLVQVIKDRNSLILLLVVPAALITLVGFAFGNFFGNGASQITIKVAVSNQDSGYVGKTIVDALKINNRQLAITVNQYNAPAQVSKQVTDGNVDAGVVIPADTTNKLITASVNGHRPKIWYSYIRCPTIPRLL